MPTLLIGSIFCNNLAGAVTRHAEELTYVNAIAAQTVDLLQAFDGDAKLAGDVKQVITAFNPVSLATRASKVATR